MSRKADLPIFSQTALNQLWDIRSLISSMKVLKTEIEESFGEKEKQAYDVLVEAIRYSIGVKYSAVASMVAEEAQDLGQICTVYSE